MKRVIFLLPFLTIGCGNIVGLKNWAPFGGADSTGSSSSSDSSGSSTSTAATVGAGGNDPSPTSSGPTTGATTSTTTTTTSSTVAATSSSSTGGACVADTANGGQGSCSSTWPKSYCCKGAAQPMMATTCAQNVYLCSDGSTQWCCQ